ncbi:uncharacterized protein [Nerophis lumbriciformis]|nr:zinc finger protein 91 isoform X2 [Nerophis lumbriciformis]
MSEDWSSDDCGEVTNTYVENTDVCKAKCWECGKRYCSLYSLISHYTSHNIAATCNICKVTFQRLTSLSLHLENVHSPPLCMKCRRGFGSVWELNKHAESLCARPKRQRTCLVESSQKERTLKVESSQEERTYEDESSQEGRTYKVESLQEARTYKDVSLQKKRTYEDESSQEERTYKVKSSQNQRTIKVESSEERTFKVKSLQEQKTYEDKSSQEERTYKVESSLEVRTFKGEHLQEGRPYVLESSQEERTQLDENSQEQKTYKVESSQEQITHLEESSQEERTYEVHSSQEERTYKVESSLEVRTFKVERLQEQRTYEDESSQEQITHLDESSQEERTYKVESSQEERTYKVESSQEERTYKVESSQEEITHLVESSQEEITHLVESSQEERTHLDESSQVQRTYIEEWDMQSSERPETSGHSVEYTLGDWDLGKPIESDEFSTDESTSTASENEDNYDDAAYAKRAESYRNDSESDSSSTDSCYAAETPASSTPKADPPGNDVSMCNECGRGPFRSLKLHRLHCSRVKVKYMCSRCKALFPSEASLSEHYIPLCSCDDCGQVFTNRDSRHQHPCSNRGSSRLIYFCSESMPKACSICKSFFVNEKSLLNHVTRVHTSVVSTKLCIVTGRTNKKPDVSAAAASGSEPLAPTLLASSSDPACQIPNLFKHVVNGKLSTSTVLVKKTSLVTSVQGLDKGSVPGILAVFQNQSQAASLTQHMTKGWRSKPSHPCRQCGTVLRQPYLAISHRYLHRGRRLHRCQCGRAFKHRLHLLRHCVQHAEAKSYICVNCGNTFAGARHFAKHMRGKTRKKRRAKCKMPFECGCGQLFYRPSAYIWHQLKNNVKSRRLTKRGK